ncbi:hypothetical protein AAMO2058_000049100 [Amorphochlora amoebiformis]
MTSKPAIDTKEKRLGVVGVGTIAKAIVRGVIKAKLFPLIVLSPRGRTNALELEKEFPGIVSIAKSNQEVVDKCKLIVFAVLPSQALDILTSLRFSVEHGIINVVSIVNTALIKQTASPCTRVARAVPLPCVADHTGVTIVSPKGEDFTTEVSLLFEKMGGCVVADDDKQCALLQATTTLMGGFYEVQNTCSKWLVRQGVSSLAAQKFLAGMFSGVALDAKVAVAKNRTFTDLVEEQTPGGLNEGNVKLLKSRKVFKVFSECLDTAHRRLSGKSQGETKKTDK